jgi:predicted nucleotidyltransferase
MERGQIDSFGLNQRDIQTIHGVFKLHSPVKRVFIFGSRATGKFKAGSDIDLAIMDEGVDEKTLSELLSEFEESTLPYRVDLVDYTKLTHPEFIKHIHEFGVAFYKRAE